MLKIIGVSKKYVTGDLTQVALKDVSLNLRDCEFVSILGPSGSGKTTLLNIIGGLDRYDSGDLIINGISTKKYKDRDWDSYRNHTIGFVFQSYNLIPHQSILSNVELALTISGVSAKERRKRALAALDEVGLKEQAHKRPNQMSGGQMQRVAIARALVNNPDILLADEPTGALDSETSLQVMELLKKVAENRLVVMVTHNAEIAEQYSTRIVKLKDGVIIGDSNPFDTEDSESVHKNMGKARMGFLTSLALSFNNLRTKKARTILTAFAGSIGIIGIALILAISNGVNQYIADIQEETMTSYPISITQEAFDLSSLVSSAKASRGISTDLPEEVKNRTSVYADYSILEAAETLSSSIAENDLKSFKEYLDNPDSEIHQYVGENGIIYTYGVNFTAYSYNKDDELIDTGASTEDVSSSSIDFSSMMSSRNEMMKSMSSMIGTSTSSANNFSELMPGQDSAVSPVVTNSYDLVYGAWPTNYDEVVLILNSKNAVSIDALYQLGFITGDEYTEISQAVKDGEDKEEISFDYDEVCDHVFYILPVCDQYVLQEDGTFDLIESNSNEFEDLVNNGVKIKISGIVKPVEDANNADMTTIIGYTSLLTNYLIDYANDSDVIKAQEKTPDINVLTGMQFEVLTDSEKVEETKEYIQKLSDEEKSSLYTMIMYIEASRKSDDETSEESDISNQQNTVDQTTGMDIPVGMTAGMDMSAMGMTSGMGTTGSVSDALDYWLENTPDEEILLGLYDEYIAGSTYDTNLEAFGKIDYGKPQAINIYTDSFENKDYIADCIEKYNNSVDDEKQIVYTDYVALLTSSITTIIDVISYVLIAFVAVSLVVSCIMIGIITHISVLERTKEIGILRALGASKRNISQVFNAETFIIGLFSGLLGVTISALLTIPINSILRALVDSELVNVNLPISDAIWLTLLSMVITVIGGLIPAKKAAKKDPVIALRTE